MIGLTKYEAEELKKYQLEYNKRQFRCMEKLIELEKQINDQYIREDISNRSTERKDGQS
jgi:hypothetical protein